MDRQTDSEPPRVERRSYDRRAPSADTLLVSFLQTELDRARRRIAELEALCAESGIATH